jgi:hypothetical protein
MRPLSVKKSESMVDRGGEAVETADIDSSLMAPA